MPVQMSGLSICPIDVETFHEINENFDLMVALKEKVRGCCDELLLWLLSKTVWKKTQSNRVNIAFGFIEW